MISSNATRIYSRHEKAEWNNLTCSRIFVLQMVRLPLKLEARVYHTDFLRLMRQAATLSFQIQWRAFGIGGMPLKRLAHPMRVRKRVNSVYTERVVVQL